MSTARTAAQASSPEASRAAEREYDVIVIGAGLGGLLAAVQFLRQGRRVVVVERLAHPGGRFTAKTFHGAQVSTGAVHMVPFGTNGELAAMLRGLGVPHRIHDAEVFASFHVRGRQYICRSILQLAPVLGPRQFAEFARLGAEMLLREPRPDEARMTYRDWLERRISRARSPELYAYFERVCHFALSIDLDDVLYPEIVETTKNMFRYGPPGIVEGGCAALTGELERRVLADGGELRLQHDVLAIEREGGRADGDHVGDQDGGRVAGVRVRDRQTGAELRLLAPMVVSNIGPAATERLICPPGGPEGTANEFAPEWRAATKSACADLGPRGVQRAGSAPFAGKGSASPDAAHPGSDVGARLVSPVSDSPVSDSPVSDSPVSDSPVSDSPVSDSPVSDSPVIDRPRRREASGLKVHLLSDESIIPHRGILYCLDTERIAGIVQPSNSDRRLAPPGKHLLITHQLLRGEEINAEREAARADLRRLFGDDFGTKIQILTMSQYRGEWPVNRAVQGEDARPQTPLAGLYLVGDAVKPSGYLMVEGVAQSVNALLDTLERLDEMDDLDTTDDLDELDPADESLREPAVSSGSHTPPKPPKRRALHWLVAPPPPRRN